MQWKFIQNIWYVKSLTIHSEAWLSNTCLSKKQAENPHLNIEYRWGMNAVNASDREIWSKK